MGRPFTRLKFERFVQTRRARVDVERRSAVAQVCRPQRGRPRSQQIWLPAHWHRHQHDHRHPTHHVGAAVEGAEYTDGRALADALSPAHSNRIRRWREIEAQKSLNEILERLARLGGTAAASLVVGGCQATDGRVIFLFLSFPCVASGRPPIWSNQRPILWRSGSGAAGRPHSSVTASSATCLRHAASACACRARPAHPQGLRVHAS